MKTLLSITIASCALVAAPAAWACEPMYEGQSGEGYFEAMDANKDGAISKKEFDAFHNKHFKEMDSNKDGKISLEEMQAEHSKMHEHKGKHMHGEHGDMLIGNRFDAADTDHDGSLTREEAKDMPMLSKYFDEIDSNKDGKVTHEEVKAMMEKNRSAGMQEKEEKMPEKK